MNKDYRGITLNGQYNGCDFSYANFTGADLSDCDFTGANFTGAILDEANLTNADLRCADLSHASFYKANFTGADLSGAVFFNTFVDKAIGLGTMEEEMQYAKVLLKLLKCGAEVFPIPNSQALSLKYPTIASYFNYSSNRETFLALQRIAAGEESVFISPFANLQ